MGDVLGVSNKEDETGVTDRIVPEGVDRAVLVPALGVVRGGSSNPGSELPPPE